MQRTYLSTFSLCKILVITFPCSLVHSLKSLPKSQILLQSLDTNCVNFYRNYTHIVMEDNQNKCELAKKLSDWSFSPSTLLSLPVDQITDNYIRRYVKNAIFSHVNPTPLKTKLSLVGISEDVLVNILDMDPEISKTEEFSDFIAGNQILSSSTPLAHRYGGHQFGVWAAQLGDGRAILLGEYKNRAGERWELQLKGSGLTPYSRNGDGRAVLRSSVREFLCAEAMHYLRVPTSRVAALVTSRDGVVRDPLYSGQPILERASVVLRLSPTWFRIGSLEILAKLGEVNSLRVLVMHVLQTLFPDVWSSSNESLDEACVLLGARVARVCYQTWVHWQRVGFTHGVLNSDNISLMGVTIDYGPFGFLSSYDPRYVPNSSDSEARYCYERQLYAVHFDLEKLRSSLEVLISAEATEVEKKGQLLQRLAREFNEARAWADTELERMFLAKIGLKSDRHARVPALLLLAMEEQKADFTATFRQLGEIAIDQLANKTEVEKYWSLKKVSHSVLWPKFVEQYLSALSAEGVSENERVSSMSRENPCYVLRNWMAQAAIEKAEKDDFSVVNQLQRILQNPYTRQQAAEKLGYGGEPPDWERNLTVSCSS